MFLLSFWLLAKQKPQFEVHLSGNTLVDSKLIYEAMGIKEKSLLEFYKDDTKYISKAKKKQLKELLFNFYRTQGFFKPDITIKKKNKNLFISIKENRFIKVSKIEVQSDFNLSSIKLFNKNERFNPTKFSKLKMDIQKSLLSHGYCDYHFENKAFVDLDKYSAKLLYEIKKSKKCKFGKVTIDGLKSIDRSVISSHINIKEGSEFNTEDIALIYSSLQQLEAFDTIVVNYSNKEKNIIPIKIDLKEREKTLVYKVGVGYDSNLGPRTSAVLEKFNFLGNAKKLSASLDLSKELYSIETKLSIPSINAVGFYVDYATSVGYKVEKYHDDFDIETLYGEMKIQQKIYDFAYHIGLGYEYSNYLDQSNEAQTLDGNNLFLLYPYLKFTYDKRDSKLNPKNGYYLSALLEYGLPYNEHARSYTKMMLEARYIQTIQSLTLSSVLKFGSIDELQNVTPENKRFFAGGSFSNRAYGYNELGVINSSSSDSTLGGVSMANLSLEANYPIYKELSGAIFSDLSMISDKEKKFDDEHITTLGAGVRYLTPIGPFKIDAGVNVNDTEQYGVTFQLGQSF